MRKLEVVSESDGPRALVGEPAVFEKLRELTRNGYVPDAEADIAAGGLLLRHESAPDLILKADGSLDLPVGQSARPRAPTAESRAEKRIYWRRTFMVVVLTIAVWFLSLAVASSFIGMIAD
jgi:hypothetical protein